MRRSRSLSLLIGGCITFLLVAPALAAAGPTVTVRVEGGTTTLLAPTSVTLGSAADVVGPAKCAGDTAYAALDSATGQNWDRQAFFMTVLGETRGADYPAPDYWAEWIGRAGAYISGSGICNDHLQAGDELLVQADDADPVTFAPLYPPVLLSGVPARVAPGTPVTVTVTRFPVDPATFVAAPAPAVGATVSGGDAAVSTDAAGHATLTLSTRGPATIRATLGLARTVLIPTCATDGADGFCDTAAPPAAAAPPDVSAAAPDTTPALGRIAAIREGQRFARGRGPRELRGTVASDPSGLSDVRLRLTCRRGTRCAQFDGSAARWVTATRCGTEHARFFSIGSAAAWSYLLPDTLTAGRYVLDTQTVDGAGNVTRGADRSTPDRPRNRVVFTVG